MFRCKIFSPFFPFRDVKSASVYEYTLSSSGTFIPKV